MASCAADAQTTALISGANVCIAHHAFSHAHESSLSIPPSPLSRLVRLTAFRKAGAFGLVTSVHVPLQRPPSRVRKTPRTNDDAPPADGEADMVSLLAQNRMRAVKRPSQEASPACHRRQAAPGPSAESDKKIIGIGIGIGVTTLSSNVTSSSSSSSSSSRAELLKRVFPHRFACAGGVVGGVVVCFTSFYCAYVTWSCRSLDAVSNVQTVAHVLTRVLRCRAHTLPDICHVRRPARRAG